MNDVIGQELKVGDWVTYTTGGDSPSWIYGRVVGFTPKMLKLDMKWDIRANKKRNWWRSDKGKPSNVAPSSCLKGEIEGLKSIIIKEELKR